MKITLTDISRHSGYSIATVSRVANGTGAGVRPEVARKIRAAVRELGYLSTRPSSRSKSASQDVISVVLHRRSALERITIGAGGFEFGPVTPADPETLLTPDWRLGNDFHRRVLEGVMDELGRHGRRAMLQVSDDLDDPALAQDAAGVILVGQEGPGLARFVDGCHAPLVLADILHDGWADQVTSDNLDGIGQAVRHLAELCHRRIGWVGGPDVRPMHERRDAFRFHAFSAGMTVEDGWIHEGDNHIANTAPAVARMLRAPSRPTAIACSNDFAAMAVLRAADEVGLRVPADLSVVGFDDAELATLATPALTSVRTDPTAIGRRAVCLLMGTRAPAPTATRGCVLRIPTTLVVRASSAPPPGAVTAARHP